MSHFMCHTIMIICKFNLGRSLEWADLATHAPGLGRRARWVQSRYYLRVGLRNRVQLYLFRGGRGFMTRCRSVLDARHKLYDWVGHLNAATGLHAIVSEFCEHEFA